MDDRPIPGTGEQTIRFSVSLPASLLAELDRRVVHRGYASRSELVRDLIRERMIDDTWSRGEEEVCGVLTIGYDHHQRDLADKLVDIQHAHGAHVHCATHIHLDHHNCLECIVLRGRPAEIEEISLEIGGLRGVHFARLTRTAPLGS